MSAPAARTRGPHFFCDPAAVDDTSAVLLGDEAHHLARVLRAEPGHPVSLADGTGALYQAHVAEVTPDRVRCAITERYELARQPPAVTVVHALPKARKLDAVVRRLSEVGADRLVPVRSARTEGRLSGEKGVQALERWRSVALAAGKQARRVRLLEIAGIGEWRSAFVGSTAGVVLWDGANVGLPGRLANLAEVDEFVIGVGPEGGLRPDELETAGLPVARLGPTILRTENAALVAAAVVMAASGRFG